MAKKRMIDTRFWADSWIRKLNALDRYLFLYLLTNDKCSFCGIYECPIDIMSSECGIEEKELLKVMLPRLRPKIRYFNGWVFILNFKKHHVNDSPNGEKGYNNALSEVPQEIKDYFFASFGKPLQAPSSPSDTITITSTITNTSVEASSTRPRKPKVDVTPLFELFGKFPPSWFRNTTQRRSAEFLLSEVGYDKCKSTMAFYRENRDEKFCPQIHTPYDLETKWSKLVSFKKKKNT